MTAYARGYFFSGELPALAAELGGSVLEPFSDGCDEDRLHFGAEEGGWRRAREVAGVLRERGVAGAGWTVAGSAGLVDGLTRAHAPPPDDADADGMAEDFGL